MPSLDLTKYENFQYLLRNKIIKRESISVHAENGREKGKENVRCNTCVRCKRILNFIG